MGSFFSTDNPLFTGLEYITNIIYASVLWILFSIPVITIGASSTALYYTVTKVIRHGRSYIFREFWQSFKSNLKQSTAVWLIYLLLMAVLLIDIRVMGGFGTAPAQTLQFIFLAGICMVSGVMVYALAYTARFAQDTKHILTNSLLMAIRHLPKTLLLIIILAAAVLGCYLFGLAVVFVPAVAALLDSLILESIFVQYMSKEDLEKEELRNHPEHYEYENRRE